MCVILLIKGYVKVWGSFGCPFVLALDRTPKGGDLI